MRPLKVSQLRDHHRRPKRPQVVGDARDRLLVGESSTVGRNLVGHPGEGLGAHG